MARRLLQSFDVFFGNTSAPQAFFVQRPYPVLVADFHKGRHIVMDSGKSADVCDVTNDHKRVDSDGGIDPNAVSQNDVAGKHDVICDCAIGADLSVVGDVDVDHQQVPIAAPGHAAAVYAAAIIGSHVNRHTFADLVVITNFQ